MVGNVYASVELKVSLEQLTENKRRYIGCSVVHNIQYSISESFQGETLSHKLSTQTEMKIIPYLNKCTR